MRDVVLFYNDDKKGIASAATPEKHNAGHQQPDVNYLPRFSPQLISLERYTLSVYRAGGIDHFENLDIVRIRLLVGVCARSVWGYNTVWDDLSDFTRPDSGDTTPCRMTGVT